MGNSVDKKGFDMARDGAEGSPQLSLGIGKLDPNLIPKLASGPAWIILEPTALCCHARACWVPQVGTEETDLSSSMTVCIFICVYVCMYLCI